jgi:hypothetical protein
MQVRSMSARSVWRFAAHADAAAPAAAGSQPSSQPLHRRRRPIHPTSSHSPPQCHKCHKCHLQRFARAVASAATATLASAHREHRVHGEPQALQHYAHRATVAATSLTAYAAGCANGAAGARRVSVGLQRGVAYFTTTHRQTIRARGAGIEVRCFLYQHLCAL